MVKIHESRSLKLGQLLGKFRQAIVRLKEATVCQIQDETEELALILHAARPVPVSVRVAGYHDETPVGPYVLMADRHEFLKIAKHILRELDPTPEEQILASLKRIELLLEPRDDGLLTSTS